MDFIELSLILDCFGDQITIKSTETYTIWLETIAKVPNMLIELKGNNYYSKVFKRVNYKLSNNTFWVVINIDKLLSYNFSSAIDNYYYVLINCLVMISPLRSIASRLMCGVS